MVMFSFLFVFMVVSSSAFWAGMRPAEIKSAGLSGVPTASRPRDKIVLLYAKTGDKSIEGFSRPFSRKVVMTQTPSVSLNSATTGKRLGEIIYYALHKTSLQ